MSFRGPALVIVVISQGSARKRGGSAGTADGLPSRLAVAQQTGASRSALDAPLF